MTKEVKGSFGLLKFPQDKLGITAGIKREMQKLGARAVGSPEKVVLVKETLEVLMQYVEARGEEKPVKALRRTVDVIKEAEASTVAQNKEKAPEGAQKGKKAPSNKKKS